jgi:hypothetical protein
MHIKILNKSTGGNLKNTGSCKGTAEYLEHENNEKKIEAILPFFSQTVFTNLSYALAYTKNDSLTDFIKRIIVNWEQQNIYRNDYLFLVNKVVAYAPMESFVYLQNATKYLKPIENEHMDHGVLS